jgi:hypothetical protein
MKNFLDTILNILTFIKENWATITCIIGLIIALTVKIKNYIKLSKEEKINLSLTSLKAVALNLVKEFADNYDENMVKRSAFFKYVVENYPVLADNLEDLIDSIDDIIDNALAVLEKQQAGEKITKTEALLIPEVKEPEIIIEQEYETITKQDIENIVKDVIAKETTTEASNLADKAD